jgi:hypothetical protein
MCLFVCNLFNDAFSVTHTMLCAMKGWQLNDELEGMRKEAVVA